jgi:hypothetical protein
MPGHAVSAVHPLPQGEEIANRCQVCADTELRAAVGRLLHDFEASDGRQRYADSLAFFVFRAKKRNDREPNSR